MYEYAHCNIVYNSKKIKNKKFTKDVHLQITD